MVSALGDLTVPCWDPHRNMSNPAVAGYNGHVRNMSDPRFDGRTPNWYPGLAMNMATGTSWNRYFYGDNHHSAVSALTMLDQKEFLTPAPYSSPKYHTYSLEFDDDEEEGFIRWFVDGVPLFNMPSASLKGRCAPGGGECVEDTEISHEPMYLIMNQAVASSFSSPCTGDPVCDAIWPGKMKIDHVRVYQNPSKRNVGCSPGKYPTAGWIEGHTDELVSRPFGNRLRQMQRNLFCGTYGCIRVRD